jgi:PAS domain S-box-containing protein
MALQVPFFGQIVFFSGVLGGVVTALIWRQRPKNSMGTLAFANLTLCLWAIGQGVVLLSEGLELKLAGFTLTMLGTATIPVGWTIFAYQYTGRGEWVTRRKLALLAVEPLVFLGLSLTNSVHELVWVDPTVTVDAGSRVLTYTFGPAALLHFTFAYALLLWANWVLFEKFLASRNVYRTRTFLFIAASITMTGTNMASTLGLSPLPHFSAVPIVYLLWGVTSLLVLTSHRFVQALPVGRVLGKFESQSKNLAPAARDTAIEEMGSGFIVTDHKNRVVDVNPMGKLIFGQEDGRIVGKRLDTLLPPEFIVSDDTELLEPDVTGQYSGVWVETADGTRRCFDLAISPLGTDDGGQLTGRVGLIHDVTEREKRKQKLEQRTEELKRQNEQLDSFASIVSHDLRNPLNVAKGRLEIIEAKTDGVEKSVAETEEALERMEDIISDVLTLARLGQTLDETEPVALHQVAQEAWDHVDTKDATFQNDIDLTVEGSESRLLQVFENLFRNAIEHGRDDVTITAGEMADGFFVEDDGPGIPADQQDEVLEQGFTTSDEGTGFGLSIISTIVDAHGWAVTVTDGSDGGARFEITGVTPAADGDVPTTAD